MRLANHKGGLTASFTDAERKKHLPHERAFIDVNFASKSKFMVIRPNKTQVTAGYKITPQNSKKYPWRIQIMTGMQDLPHFPQEEVQYKVAENGAIAIHRPSKVARPLRPPVEEKEKPINFAQFKKDKEVACIPLEDAVSCINVNKEKLGHRMKLTIAGNGTLRVNISFGGF